MQNFNTFKTSKTSDLNNNNMVVTTPLINDTIYNNSPTHTGGGQNEAMPGCVGLYNVSPRRGSPGGDGSSPRAGSITDKDPRSFGQSACRSGRPKNCPTGQLVNQLPQLQSTQLPQLQSIQLPKPQLQQLPKPQLQQLPLSKPQTPLPLSLPKSLQKRVQTPLPLSLPLSLQRQSQTPIQVPTTNNDQLDPMLHVGEVERYVDDVSRIATLADAYALPDGKEDTLIHTDYMSYLKMVVKNIGEDPKSMALEEPIPYPYKRDNSSRGKIYACGCTDRRLVSSGIVKCKHCRNIVKGSDGVLDDLNEENIKKSTDTGCIRQLLSYDLAAGNAAKGLNKVLKEHPSFRKNSKCKAWVIYTKAYKRLATYIATTTIPPYPISPEDYATLKRQHVMKKGKLQTLEKLQKAFSKKEGKAIKAAKGDKGALLCSMDSNKHMKQTEETGFTDMLNPSTGKYLLSTTSVHLTYSYQSPKKETIEYLRKKIRELGVELRYYSMCHEKGTNDGDGKTEPYEHQHVALQFSACVRISNPRFFDYRHEEATTAEQQHPHIKGMNLGNWNYVCTEYHTKDDENPYTNYYEDTGRFILMAEIFRGMTEHQLRDLMIMKGVDAASYPKYLRVLHLINLLEPIDENVTSITKLTEFLNWQAVFEEIREMGIFDDRCIFWIYDEIGSSGKSKYGAHIENFNCFYTRVVKANDIMHLYSKFLDRLQAKTGKLVNYVPAIVLDLGRMDDAESKNVYSLAESLKSTTITSGKYDGGVKHTLNSPMVLILSNSPPIVKYLSLDRWIILMPSLDGKRFDYTFAGKSGNILLKYLFKLEKEKELIDIKVNGKRNPKGYILKDSIARGHIQPISSYYPNDCFSIKSRTSYWDRGVFPMFTVSSKPPMAVVTGDSDLEITQIENTFTVFERPLTKEEKEGYELYKKSLDDKDTVKFEDITGLYAKSVETSVNKRIIKYEEELIAKRDKPPTPRKVELHPPKIKEGEANTRKPIINPNTNKPNNKKTGDIYTSNEDLADSVKRSTVLHTYYNSIPTRNVDHKYGETEYNRTKPELPKSPEPIESKSSSTPGPSKLPMYNI